MALSAVAVYAPGRELAAVAAVALIFGAINLPSVSVWTLKGQGLRQFLAGPRRLRAYDWLMAGLLVVSMIPML